MASQGIILSDTNWIADGRSPPIRLITLRRTGRIRCPMRGILGGAESKEQHCVQY
ncbi:MAG: hypothetical protein E5299_00413 [Burkholderia gladioli]|nr:MAG: hypothetical protein E5299_00413 [Burkholderia gladioli]